MVFLTYCTSRNIFILGLIAVFLWASIVAFINLLHPEIGLTLKKETGGNLPSFTVCPYEYSNPEWKLTRTQNSFSDILSILPSMRNYVELSIGNTGSEYTE